MNEPIAADSERKAPETPHPEPGGHGRGPSRHLRPLRLVQFSFSPYLLRLIISTFNISI